MKLKKLAKLIDQHIGTGSVAKSLVLLFDDRKSAIDGMSYAVTYGRLGVLHFSLDALLGRNWLKAITPFYNTRVGFYTREEWGDSDKTNCIDVGNIK